MVSRICLVAGSGSLPQIFRKSAQESGLEVLTVGVKGITDIKADEYLPLGGIKRLVQLLEKKGIKDIVLLGKFEHKLIFTHLFGLDELAFKILRRARDKRPESVVRTLIEELQGMGFNFIDPKPYLSSLLIGPGRIGSLEPAQEVLESALFGFPIALEIASMDIGQTLVVKDKAVVSVEAMEGTQEAILRAGKLAGSGCIVIKVARRNQDFRIDVPTVGLKTLEVIRKIKGRALFIQAGKVYLLDKEKMISFADRYSIVLYAL